MINKRHLRIYIMYKIKGCYWLLCFFIIMMSALVYMMYYMNCVADNNINSLYFFEYLVGYFINTNRINIVYPLLVLFFSYNVFKSDKFNNLLIIKNDSRKDLFINYIASVFIVNVIINSMTFICLYLNSILVGMQFNIDIKESVIEEISIYLDKSDSMLPLIMMTVLKFNFYTFSISIIILILFMKLKNNVYVVAVYIMGMTVIYEISKFRLFGSLNKYLIISDNIADLRLRNHWGAIDIIYWICVLGIVLYSSYKSVKNSDLEIEKRMYDN